MALDLVDFKDRVRPLSRDIAMIESASKFQKENVDQLMSDKDEFKKMLKEVGDGTYEKIEEAQADAEEGYSSMEIPEPSTPAQETIEEEV